MITLPQYALAPDLGLGAEMARIFQEEIGFICTQLTQNVDVDEAVHQARKSVKRLRALLRLARPALAPAVYEAENVALRDIGRLLAARRDATVRRELVAALADEVPGAHRSLLSAAVEEHAPGDSWPVVTAEALPRLDGIAARLPTWGLAGVRPAHLALALRRIYGRGRRRMATATGTTVAEAWHEWRKEVKYLWHQVQLLEKAWPPILIPLAEALHALSDALGDRHDLDILLAVTSDVAVPDLAAELAERQVPLDRQATALGERLYAERPAAFAGRLVAYWTASPLELRDGDDH